VGRAGGYRLGQLAWQRSGRLLLGHGRFPGCDAYHTAAHNGLPYAALASASDNGALSHLCRVVRGWCPSGARASGMLRMTGRGVNAIMNAHQITRAKKLINVTDWPLCRRHHESD
jgi:hypothetical protein